MLLLINLPTHSPISYFRQGPQARLYFDNFISSDMICPYAMISDTAVYSKIGQLQILFMILS
jgi:hypothetical protein